VVLASQTALELDGYVIDVLMRDLVGHDKMPSAFIVYVYLAARVERQMTRGISASYSHMASATGLSKTAVQKAVAHLVRRKLISVSKASATATPVYRLNRHWRPRLKTS
jgi:hypothetical protein